MLVVGGAFFFEVERRRLVHCFGFLLGVGFVPGAGEVSVWGVCVVVWAYCLLWWAVIV